MKPARDWLMPWKYWRPSSQLINPLGSQTFRRLCNSQILTPKSGLKHVMNRIKQVKHNALHVFHCLYPAVIKRGNEESPISGLFSHQSSMASGISQPPLTVAAFRPFLFRPSRIRTEIPPATPRHKASRNRRQARDDWNTQENWKWGYFWSSKRIQ